MYYKFRWKRYILASLHGLGHDVEIPGKDDNMQMTEGASSNPSMVLGECCILVRARSFNDPSGVRRFWKKFLRWPGLQMRKQTPRQDTLLGCFERGWHALSILLFQLRTCPFLCIAYLSLTLLMFCHRRRDRHKKDENTRHCSWQIKTDLIDAQKFKQASQQMHCHPFQFLAFLVNLEARWGSSLYIPNAYEFSSLRMRTWSGVFPPHPAAISYVVTRTWAFSS